MPLLLLQQLDVQNPGRCRGICVADRRKVSERNVEKPEGIDVEMKGREAGCEGVSGTQSDKNEQCKRNEVTARTHSHKDNLALFLWTCAAGKSFTFLLIWWNRLFLFWSLRLERSERHSITVILMRQVSNPHDSYSQWRLVK